MPCNPIDDMSRRGLASKGSRAGVEFQGCITQNGDSICKLCSLQRRRFCEILADHDHQRQDSRPEFYHRN